jgi:hypothetical protein
MPTPPPFDLGSSTSINGVVSDANRYISDDDVQTIVEKFCFLLGKLDFDEAISHIESHKLVTGHFSHPGDKIWQQLLLAISQISQAELSYFTLGFFSTKFSFRKDPNQTRDLFTKIRQDLRRCDDNASSPFSHPESINNVLRKKLVDHFCSYASARIDMIAFYVGLQGKDWRSVVDESSARLNAVKNVYSRSTPSPLFPQADLITRELDILTKSFLLKKLLCRCVLLDSLLLLKELRDLFSSFFYDLQPSSSTKPSANGIFSFMKPTKTPPKFVLLVWLNSLYEALLTKFSLYFSDVLSPYIPPSELKIMQTTSPGLHSYFLYFSKKYTPITIAVVMCRGSEDEPFYGFGYHRSLQNFPTPATQPLKDEYPVLVNVTHEKQKGNYETYKSKIDDCLSFCAKAAISEAKPKYYLEKEKTTENTFFCTHIEWKLFLVIYFDRKISEKDAAVLSFISDIVSSLRFTKLYQELKSPIRSANSTTPGTTPPIPKNM